MSCAPPRSRLIAWVLLVAALSALAGPLAAARADGDPASDVLADAPPLFLSADSGATFAEKTAIVDQLRVAAQHGHRLYVAVISTRTDLGSVTALWEQPQEYAEFLGRELPYTYRGELLVVMPSGFGVSRAGSPVATPLARLAPRTGELVTATEQAVQRLTGVRPTAVRVATTPAPSPLAGPGWWTTTALAALVIVAGWTASLRIRPPGRRRGERVGPDHAASQ